MLLEELYPDEVTASVYEMDWGKLAEDYDGVIFDIDNTLVPHGAGADGPCACSGICGSWDF